MRSLIATLVAAALLPIAAAANAPAGGPITAPAVTPRAPVPAFVLDRGRYKSFEASDPTVTLAPGGINNRGLIAGEYLTPTRESGFLRDRRGRITKIDFPGAAGTQIDKINDRGQIIGNYSRVAPFLPGEGSRGFVLYRGKVTRIDIPGARLTAPHGINDRGHVVGQYKFAEGADHGFLWKRGRITTFDVPGATSTAPLAINNRGDVVGSYADSGGTLHGFLLRDGAYTSFDARGGGLTFPFDINDRGQIVVSSVTPTADDGLAGARGFVLRDGVDGPFTEIAFPGAPGTLATGIDDRGRIVGLYENPNAAPSGARSRAAASPWLDALPLAAAAALGHDHIVGEYDTEPPGS
jgi:probable HAF family extracellular repeat protein